MTTHNTQHLAEAAIMLGADAIVRLDDPRLWATLHVDGEGPRVIGNDADLFNALMATGVAALRKQVELLEKRIRHCDVELAQARISIDVWKGKTERAYKDCSSFISQHGLTKEWEKHLAD